VLSLVNAEGEVVFDDAAIAKAATKQDV
jgi:hypothetical protein